MRNRAKCKLCSSIIESKSSGDEVSCACGHISVTGGDMYGCSAIEWCNFLRIDDNGHEIIPTIQESKPSRVTKIELLNALDEMIKRIEDMPQNALVVAINHYDYLSILTLLSCIFRCESDEGLK
jgi:hypothetical protein